MPIDFMPARASVHPFMVHTAPRWRLRLRAWWLQRRGRALLQPVGGTTAAGLDFTLRTVPSQEADAARSERGLLELNLMFERARAHGTPAVRQVQP